MPGKSSLASRVPFFDLAPSHEPLKGELLDAISELYDTGAFTNGPAVADFEAAFAAYCGTEHCVGVASGLDALRLGLVAAGLEPGDPVAMPAFTFVATAEAVSQAGGRPVLVDVSEKDYCIDVEAAASESARFLLPVHLFGQLADLDALDSIGTPIVEDACQAHGASRDGRRAGASGLFGAFSFYPAKNLGAFGDAGALTTNDAEIATRVRALREHGQTAKYHHDVEGWTSRLDTIQALVLLHKLPHLDRWNNERREIARFYSSELAGIGDLHLPPVAAGSDPVWHLYVIRTGESEALIQYLQDLEIATARHYPEPVHLTSAYRHLGYARGDFPVAERLAAEAVSLPLFPGLTEDQQETVVTGVRRFFGG